MSKGEADADRPVDVPRTESASDPDDSNRDAAGEPSGVEKLRQSLPPKADAGDDPEKELWIGGFSGKAMFGSWLLALLATVAGLVLIITFFNTSTGWMIWGIGIVVAWGWPASVLAYRKFSIRYELTTQRFIHMEGILKRRVDRIEVIDIDDVTYQQGIVERMLGVGSIRITSSDRSHPDLALRGIENVKQIADMIDDVRRKERRRRGVHIEAI